MPGWTALTWRRVEMGDSAVVLWLDETLDTLLDDRVKGMPGGTEPVLLRDVGSQGWNILADDLPLPLLVLKRKALQANLTVMRNYCVRHGVALAPHGKTTMAPQLFDAQLRMGAWGITAATVQQLQVYRRVGVTAVMFANELVGRFATTYVTRELARDPALDFYSWVDSPAAVEELSFAAREARPGQRFRVLLEVGHPGGRGGVRSPAQLDAVLTAVQRNATWVELVGVAGFEGLLDAEAFAGLRSVNPGVLTVEGYLERVASVTDKLVAGGVLPDDFVLTAGGSTSFGSVVTAFDRFIGTRATVLLRSGCYLTHDHFMNAKTSVLSAGNSREADEFGHLEPALELWAHVQSIPEDGLALLTFGRRDAPFDYGLPVPLRRYPVGSREPVALPGASIAALNDQHAYLRDARGLCVGDRIVLGISHPCTAFDKWRFVTVVSEDYDVVDGILTYF